MSATPCVPNPACSAPDCSERLPDIPARANWLAVGSLSLGVFGLVTSEFLPASLLTGIAISLQVSDGAAGQAVTATALVGAVAAPTLPLLTRGVDRRLVLIGFTLLLLLSNLLSVLANSLAALLLARVLLGVALGGFWSMSAALTMRLVPTPLFARALSVVIAGMSFATVCAAPIGAWMGDHWGWRSAFMAAGAISIVTLVAQVMALPALPARDKPDLRALGHLLRQRKVQIPLLTILLLISGHFAGFTYVRPLMEQITHLSPGSISAVLLGYGVAGFLGNFVGGWLTGRDERLAIILGSITIALLAAALLGAGESVVVTATAITLWGFAFSFFPVAFQTWFVRAAPGQTESASGLMVTAFQVAIATGAVAGGLMVDHLGALGAPLFALVVMVLGALLVLSSRRGG